MIDNDAQAELNENALNALPDEDAIKVTGGSQWRFSKGKIVRGEEKDGKYEGERERIVGILQRVGIFDGVGKTDGQPYRQVEADFLTKEGVIHVKAGLSDPDVRGQLVMKPSVSAVKFAWGLTQFKKGDAVMITATQSKDPVVKDGRKLSKVTYVNWFKVDGNNATPLYSPKRDPNEQPASLQQQWDAIEPLIRSHPAYAPRVDSEASDHSQAAAATHLQALSSMCRAKGWPTPDQQPVAWLNFMKVAFQQEEAKARLTDWDDDDWGECRQLLQDRETIPGKLQQALDAVSPTKPAQATIADID